MVSPSRSSTSRRRRDDAGKLFVGVLILLGLIASVFLIFSNSLQLIRIGLVAALWAAVIGALAATRYRRESAVDQAKARDLQTVYELQLEREINARREYELGVEARVREEVGADAAEMAALRAELAVLRESLQRLFDGDLPVERPALRADAVRMQELPEAAANGSSSETETWDAWSSPMVPRASMRPVFEPDHPEPPIFASPDDDPVTAETAVVSADFGETEDGADEVESFGYAEYGHADRRTEPIGGAQRNGWESDSNGWESDSVVTRSAERLSPNPGGGEVEPPWAPAPAAAPVSVGSASSRRRRRAESEGDAYPGRQLSVAEIMANLRSEQS
ncbi:DUF6779 domain-containing protein [Nocardia mexicana]|uniref:DUF6779 domain-containing protein n=1 Tax=Nocardia mexicana TaxID=279262 RepID=A0A370GTV0_9NOCA|nr:DUF6779 domain-containing protein [Nocardia mexicana]RDI47128.1 hypothetical protein DFR68_109127 [Nocardia mexicana]